jgi:hypothetical protein
MEVDEYIKLLAGLLSVVDPIGAIPLFISLTDRRSSDERRRIAYVCALSVGTVLMFAHTTGNTWPAKDDARAVRRDVRAKVVGPSVAPLSNGLTPGLYTAPIAEYIYPETTQYGARSNATVNAFPVPVAFENFCFLRKSGATITTLEAHAIGPLTPFPDSGHPQSQVIGAGASRVCGD